MCNICCDPCFQGYLLTSAASCGCGNSRSRCGGYSSCCGCGNSHSCGCGNSRSRCGCGNSYSCGCGSHWGSHGNYGGGCGNYCPYSSYACTGNGYGAYNCSAPCRSTRNYNITVNIPTSGGGTTPVTPTTQYAVLTATTGAVAAGAPIPLNRSALSGTSITHTNGASTVNLAPGTYGIYFSGNVTLPAAGTASVSVRNNGTVIDNATATATASPTADLGGHTQLTVTSPAAIDIINSSAAAATFNGFDLSIVKLY